MRRKFFSVIIVLVMLLGLAPADAAYATFTSLEMNSKVLTPGRAIAAWPSGIPSGEKRPVVIFLPGWGGEGDLNAWISPQNTNLVNEGYVTLAIGFDYISTYVSDSDVKTMEGLDKLCADASIPANCDAIVLDGESYGGSQNYWVIEYLRSHGYDGGAGSAGKTLGFISEDTGYAAPGVLTNPVTGAFTRTGLADNASYSVAMIQNLGDTRIHVDECTWGYCGERELSNAHLARGDNNVFSICPFGGEHTTREFADWNAWVTSAIKTMIHVINGIPVFTGYTNPTMVLGNTCANANIQFEDVPSSHWASIWIERLYKYGITRGCNTSPLLYCPEAAVTRAQMSIFILRSKYTSAYTPPVATGTVFSDVPIDSFGAAWIEQFALEGITSGCGFGIYCPDANITRAQMAIFLLRGKHGSSYVPPVATGIFSDVPVGSFAADWIEQLAVEGITSGCGGGNYCPNANMTRAQMAGFLVRAFNLR